MKRIYRITIVILVVLAIVTGVLAVYVIYVQPMMYQNYYLDIMRKCNGPSKKATVRSWFIRDYNFTEIYDWVHARARYTKFLSSI